MSALHFRHRILYVGDDPDLAGLLMTALRRHACQVVRSPASPPSRYLVLGDAPYSLLLLDDAPECRELVRLARTLEHRRRTPIISVSDSNDFRSLADAIARRLDARRAPDSQ
jgi:DNA-binding response OmpR family regulator